MLCAVMNDLRVCARLARPQTGHTLAVTNGNVLPPIYWGSGGRKDSVDVGVGYESSSEQSTKPLAEADSASRLMLRSEA